MSGNAVAAATNGGVALYREGEAGPWQFFNRAEGKGLPGNLGNAILAAPGGSVFYACTCGLATARRGGRDWSFLRGADSKAKNEGLYKPQIPAGQEEAAKKPGSLPEDYVTALYLDGASLWLGFREKGVQRLRLRDMAPVEDKDAETFNADKDARHRWVRKFVRLSDGSLYAATNGGGLRLVTATTTAPKDKRKKKNEKPAASAAAVDFPAVPVMDMKAINAMAARLPPAKEVKSGCKKQPLAAPFFWKDDWLTRGNWTSVYGRMYAILCAAISPDNITIECDAERDRYKVEGPSARTTTAAGHRRSGGDNSSSGESHSAATLLRPRPYVNCRAPRRNTCTGADWSRRFAIFPPPYAGRERTIIGFSA